jgi:hypothetical protein
MTFHFNPCRALFCTLFALSAVVAVSPASAGSGSIAGWTEQTQALLEAAMKRSAALPADGEAEFAVRLDASGVAEDIRLVRASFAVGSAARQSVEQAVAQMPRLPLALQGRPIIVKFHLTYATATGARSAADLQQIARAKADAAMAQNARAEAIMAVNDRNSNDAQERPHATF